MPETDPKEQRELELTLHVFAMCAGLVGVCLTAIGLFRVFSSHAQVKTVADELLALDAVMFMLCCFLSFWSLKTDRPKLRRALRRLIDALFLAALAFMVIVCGLVAYEVV